MDWNGATAGDGTAPNTTGAQAANLDNNSGPETYDEQPLLNGAIVAGTYQAPSKPGKAVSDEGTLLRTAEDIAIQKSNDNASLEQGDITKWTLNVQTSEYRTVDDVVVHDTLPNGLCPLGTPELREPGRPEGRVRPGRRQDAERRPTRGDEQANGTYDITWDKSTVPALAHFEPERHLPAHLLLADPRPLPVELPRHDADPLQGQRHQRRQHRGRRLDPPRRRRQQDRPRRGRRPARLRRLRLGQGGRRARSSRRRSAAHLPASGDCNDLAGAAYGKTVPVYGPGDQVCWKLRLVFPTKLDTDQPGRLRHPPERRSPTSARLGPGDRANTVPISPVDTTDDGRLSWSIGSGGTTSTTAARSSRSPSRAPSARPPATPPGDVEGNLMKFSYENTAGHRLPAPRPHRLRAQGAADLARQGRAPDHGDGPVYGPNRTTSRSSAATPSSTASTSRTPAPPPPASSASGTCSRPASPAPTYRRHDLRRRRLRRARTGSSGPAWRSPPAPARRKTLTYSVHVPADVEPGSDLHQHRRRRRVHVHDERRQPYQLIPNNTDGQGPGAAGRERARQAEDPSDVLTARLDRRQDPDDVGHRDRQQRRLAGDDRRARRLHRDDHDPEGHDAVRHADRRRRARRAPDARAGQPLVAGLHARRRRPTGGVAESPANTVTRPFPAHVREHHRPDDGSSCITFQRRRSSTSPRTPAARSLRQHGDADLQGPGRQPHPARGSVNTTIVEPKINAAKALAGSASSPPARSKTFTVTASASSGTNCLARPRRRRGRHRCPSGPRPGGIDRRRRRLGPGRPRARSPGPRPRRRPSPRSCRAPSVPLTYKVKIESPAVGGKTYTNAVDDDHDEPRERHRSGTRRPRRARRRRRTTRRTRPTRSQRRAAGDHQGRRRPTKATIGDNVVWTVHVTVPANVRVLRHHRRRHAAGRRRRSTAYGAVTCTAGCTGSEPAISTFPVTTAGATKQAAWFLGDVAPTRRGAHATTSCSTATCCAT